MNMLQETNNNVCKCNISCGGIEYDVDTYIIIYSRNVG